MIRTPYVRTMVALLRDVFLCCVVMPVIVTRKCKYTNVLWTILAVAICAEATPVKRSISDVNNYLMQYGYLPETNGAVGNLMLEDEYKKAIRKLQEFAGITVTGEIDDETKQLLSMPRCGLPDYEKSNENRRRKRYLIQGPKWDHLNITWSLSLKNPPTNINVARTRHAIREALSIWEKSSRLTFREINSDQADILISFVRGYHYDNYKFDGPGGVLAHAFFPGVGLGGDVHFDDVEPWILEISHEKIEEGTSLYAVAAHEFGHSLGLSHSSVKDALMYPWYKGTLPPNYQLPEDDRRGIETIYGIKDAWRKIPNRRFPFRTTTTQAPTTTTTRRTRWPNHRHHQTHATKRPTYPYYPDRRYNTLYPETTRKPEIPRKHPKKTTTHYYESPYKPVTTQKPDMPDKCDMSYDAITMIRRELFIFKDKYHWRIGDNGLQRGYPTYITHLWKGLPKDLTHVDAVYVKPDGKVCFFIGKEIYLFDIDQQRVVDDYPKPLTSLNLPADLTHIDAAMIWGYNKKTYLYSGNKYWKLNERTGKVDYDYPRDMTMWKGVGYNIDSVFQWKDNRTYFFKGKGFWRFNDLEMKVEKDYQLPSAHKWMGCPAVKRHPNDAPAPTESLMLPSKAETNRDHKTLTFIFIISLLNLYFTIT